MSLLAQIRQLANQKAPFVISIDGHGGSGKTTLSKLLGEQLNATVVHTDNFASWKNDDWPRKMEEQIFQPITNGAKTLSYPLSEHEPGKSRGNIVDQPVTQIFITEGVGSSEKRFRPYIDFAIFVDVPSSHCLERGVQRELIATPHKSESELRKEWETMVQEELDYFERDNPKAFADVVLDGTQPFEPQVL